MESKITDAIVLNKNETECSNESISNTNNSNITDTVPGKQVSLRQDNNCNISNFNSTQKINLITLDISANISLNNSSNTSTNSTDDCEQNTAADKCLTKLLATNEIPKSDTVLKYVYNKDDKSFVKEKPKSHPLNSVQRKRRSIFNRNITVDTSLEAPLIVDYETSHPPRDKEIVLPVPERITGNTIQNSALADFTIETLHEPNQPSKNYLTHRENSSSQSEEDNKESAENKDYSQSNSYESSESDYLKTKENSDKKPNRSYESDESKEKEQYRENESGSSSVEDSRENDDERVQQKKTPQKPVDSFEIYKDKKYPSRNTAATPTRKHSSENYESNEKENSKSLENSESNDSSENTSRESERDKSAYTEDRDDSPQTSEKDKYRDHESSHDKQSHDNFDRNRAYNNQADSIQSEENSHEHNNDNRLLRPQTKKRLEDNDQTKERDINLSTPRTIQDVDLGDFSYEKGQVDDKGKIVAAREQEENISPIPIKPLVSPGLDQNQLTGSLLLKDEDEYTNRGLFDTNNPVHLNDGEVKPVVEINSEPNESDSYEENSKGAIRTILDKDESLETILGINTNDSEEQNEKVIESKEPEDKADVKQQFERIPLDYKHGNKQEENNKNVQSDSKDHNTPQEENEDVTNNEGTLDTFSPKDVNYDEHLKFKFDDVSIKLPEIKLPEDILAYAYENPIYENRKDKHKKIKPKPKFYPYSEEGSYDSPREQKNSRHNEDNDDNDHDYYGHKHAYDKQKLKKKGDDEEDDEHVDLYEKFVRERFGKRGSFEKRSEKLQDARDLPYNPKLYENVQNILKKAAHIDKQAKKSGDPNAGYSWTLEYGENLK